MGDEENVSSGPSRASRNVGRQTIDLASGPLSVLRVGAADGERVLLVHGGGFDEAALSYEPLMRRAPAEWQLIAVDLPGSGESPPFSEGPPSTERYALVVGSLMDHFGASRLVGESLGGAVALLVALERPDEVPGLVLAGCHGLSERPPGGLLTFLAARVPGAQRVIWEALARDQSLLRRALQAFMWGDEPIDEVVVEDVYRALDPKQADEVFRRWQKTELLLPDGFRTDLRDRLEEVNMPVLVVHGRDDPIVDVEDARRAAKAIPEGRYVELEGCGHWPPREAPERFEAELWDFLDQTR